MRMCQEHYDVLRGALTDGGLWSLVGTADSMRERILEELAGSATPATHDPLYSLVMLIYGNAVQVGGPYLMGLRGDGSEYCPLCEVGSHLGVAEVAKWIEVGVAAQLEYCREHNLIPRVQ